MTEIQSVHDPRIQHLLKLKKDRDYRRDKQAVLMEGKNTLLDFAKKHRLKTLVHTEDVVVDIDADEILCVPYHIIEKLASSVSPEGIIGEVAAPKFVTLE